MSRQKYGVKWLEENRQIVALGILLAAFYIYIAVQIPYTHDDWDWGLANGWEQLITANINSRYSGNLLEVLMTRSELFKSLFMGLVFTALPIAIAMFTVKDKTQGVSIILASNILLLLLPQTVWQQTYGWVAGFANFVTSALWVSLFFDLSRGLFQKNAIMPVGALKCIMVGIFCVSMQLFAENITVFMIGVSIVFWGGALIKWRKISGYYTMMLLGSITGAGIMFSSSMYETLLSTGQAVDGYRELTFDTHSSLIEIIQGFSARFFGEFMPGIYGGDNWFYCVIISMLFIVLLAQVKERKLKYPMIGLVILSTIAVIMMALAEKGSIKILASVSVGYFLSIFLSIIVAFSDKKLTMLKLSGIWWAHPLVMVPLVVINTVGERSFLMPIVFLVMFIAALLSEIKINWRADKVLSICLLVLMIYWGVIYTDIGIVKRERAEIINEAILNEASEIILPQFPHEEYLWWPDPKSEYRRKYFRLFYGLNESVEIKFTQGGE